MASLISVADIRAEGVTVTMASDVTVQASIDLWQQFLERACRQWFDPRAGTLELDGTDSDALHFPVPIISVSALYVNSNVSVALDPDRYRVYSNQGGVADDRYNPRIKIVGFEEVRDIFSTPILQPSMRLIFRKGRQNQKVVGVFGFTEPNGTPPLLVKRALTKLVIEKLGTPLFVDPASPSSMPAPPDVLAGLLTEETTDAHTKKWQVPVSKPRAAGLNGITQDREILDIIRLYKSAMAMATPANFNPRA